MKSMYYYYHTAIPGNTSVGMVEMIRQELHPHKGPYFIRNGGETLEGDINM